MRTVDHVFYDRDLKKGFDRLKSKEWWASHWQQAQQQTSAYEGARIESSHDKDIHLMLPIWVRRAQRAWYKEDDPQWKANQSFAKDKKRQDAVAHKISALVREHLLSDQYRGWIQYLQTLQIGMELDLVIPIAPAAHYEVPCIFISPSGDVTYGWRRLPDSVGAKMDRIFHPVMLSKAFYAGCKEFARVTYIITKARVADTMNTFRDEGKANKTLTEEEKANRSLAIAKASDQTLKRVLPFLRGEYGDHDSRQAYRDAVRAMTYKAAIERGCVVFRNYWVMGQATEMQKPNGSLVVFKGMVRCVGDKGQLLLQVAVFYDVATESIIGKPVYGAAEIVPNPDNWHGVKSQSPTSSQGHQALAIKQARPAKPGLKPPANSAEPPRETPAQSASPVKDEEE